MILLMVAHLIFAGLIAFCPIFTELIFSGIIDVQLAFHAIAFEVNATIAVLTVILGFVPFLVSLQKDFHLLAALTALMTGNQLGLDFQLCFH